MACVLRLSGKDLDVDELLAKVPLHPEKVWKKGEPRRVGPKLESESGASVLVSQADLDQLARQLEEAESFLQQHGSLVSRAAGFPGVQYAVLDFGVGFAAESVALFCHLPASLVQLAARAGVAVEFSVYACSSKE